MCIVNSTIQDTLTTIFDILLDPGIMCFIQFNNEKINNFVTFDKRELVAYPWYLDTLDCFTVMKSNSSSVIVLLITKHYSLKATLHQLFRWIV